MNSDHLYGLAERADQFLLRDTLNGDPYKLCNVDIYPHDAYA